MTDATQVSAYSWPPLSAAAPAAAKDTGEVQGLLREERRAAREQGYGEGLRQGERDAQERLAAVLASLAEQTDALLQQWQAEQKQLRQRFDALLSALGHRLVVSESVASTELLDQLLEEATRQGAMAAPELTLRLAKEYEPLLATWQPQNSYQVQIDDTLEAGRVVLKAAARVADFNPATLVDQVLSALPSPLPEAEKPAADESDPEGSDPEESDVEESDVEESDAAP